jgi:hypothetical protein
MKLPIAIAIAIPMVAVALVACNAERGDAPSAPPVAALPTRAPLTVVLDGPQEVTGGEVALTMSLRGRLPRDVDGARVDFTVPKGATLLDEDTARRPVRVGEVRTLRLRLDGEPPATDFVVTASVQGASYGVTSRAAFRFGRPPPRLPVPKLVHRHRTNPMPIVSDEDVAGANTVYAAPALPPANDAGADPETTSRPSKTSTSTGVTPAARTPRKADPGVDSLPPPSGGCLG